MSKNPKPFLIIKPSSLGDILHTIPSLKILKKHYPQPPVHWLVKKEYASFLKELPEVDKVIPFPRSEWTIKSFPFWLPSFFRWLWSWQGPYQAVFDFQGLFRSGLFSYLSGASLRVGFSHNREGASLFYTHRVRVSPKDHVILQNASLLEPLGIREKPNINHQYLEVPDFYKQRIAQKFPFLLESPTLLVCPFARWPSKYYPFPKWAFLLEKLYQIIPSHKLVIIGSSAHIREFQQLQRLCKAPLVNLIGKTSLWELASLLQRSELLISLETGPMHLASLLQKRVIALFGPNRPSYVAPFCEKAIVLQAELPCSGCEKKICPLGHAKCMDELDPQKILEKILFSLNLSYTL
ncbi:MAG: glycosyltransferase family 9 protein [Planctomycetota bacterium]|nr:MAG: glycosyltransferase family 9 protein [Planctomycetota bacterium]